MSDEQATDGDGDRVDYLKREYFLPAQRARPDASLEDDDSHDLFMSEPSISEADESEFASNMRLLSPLESFDDDEDEDNQLAPPLPPPPLPPTPSRNTPQAPPSPGNTSLSSWESSQVSRRGVHLHFSPDHRATAGSPFQRKEFPSNQQAKQNSNSGPPVDSGGNITPTDFLAAALIPPSSGAKTPDRSFVHSSNSTSPASEGHRKVFEAFLDGLRLESQGKVQNTTDTNLSFESSSYFDYGRGMDLQGVLRPQQDTTSTLRDKQQHQDDVQDNSVDTHSTDPNHPGTPGVTGDETIAMVLSDDSVEEFSKLSGLGDDGSMSSHTNQPLVWEEKSSSSEGEKPPPPPPPQPQAQAQAQPQPQPQTQSQPPLASENPFKKSGSMSPPEKLPRPKPSDSKANSRVNVNSKAKELPPRREGSSTSLNSLNVDTFQHPDATSRAEIEKFSQFAIGTADSFQDSFQFLAPPPGENRRSSSRRRRGSSGLSPDSEHSSGPSPDRYSQTHNSQRGYDTIHGSLRGGHARVYSHVPTWSHSYHQGYHPHHQPQYWSPQPPVASTFGRKSWQPGHAMESPQFRSFQDIRGASPYQPDLPARANSADFQHFEQYSPHNMNSWQNASSTGSTFSWLSQDHGAHAFPSPLGQEGTPLVGPRQMYGPHFAPSLRRDSSRSNVSPNMSTRVSFGQRFDEIRERVQASPFANIGKRFTKADRKRFLPSGLNDAIDKYPTFICPVCKTRQREFFTVSTAPLQFESASGYIAFYFTIYVIAALYIFGLQEGWSKLDCIYFAVITLTTAGLGDFVPTSTGAKVVCSIFIYFGVACIGLLLGSYIAGMLDESSRRAVKENRIKSCPNCARIQNIKEAAERRRKQFRRQRKMEKNAAFASSPMEGDEDTPHHNSKRVKRNPTTESLSAADMVRLAREELVESGLDDDQAGLNPLTPRSASDLEEIPENTINDLSPIPSTPLTRTNMLTIAHNSPSTRQILRRQGHSRHMSFDGRDKGPRPRRVFSADLGVPGTDIKDATKGVASSVRITPTQQIRWHLSDSSGSEDDDDDDSFASTDSVDGSQMDDILEPHLDRVKNARYVFLTLREALLNSLVIIGFGCFGFYMIEGFSVVDSWYFTTVLLTTVGYGDFVPYTKGGKLFATIYILVAGTILLNNMSLISMIPLELRRRRTEKAVLTQFGDSLDDMALRELATGPLIRRLHLATDDNGELDECTREMFCLAMLVRLGKVTEEDIKLTMAAFKKLDVNNEQVLNTRAIIAGMIQKSRSTAYLNRMNQKEDATPNQQAQPSYGAVNPPPPPGQELPEDSYDYDGYDVSYETSPPTRTQDFWISRSSERSGQHGAFFS